MATKIKKSRSLEAEVFLIQFITDDPILITGTGSVAVRGQLLEVGPGKIGANFPYRDPEGQLSHYGEQKYVLIAAYNAAGEEIDHDDVERTADGSVTFIDPEDAASEPAFQNRGTNIVGGDKEEKKISKPKNSSKPKSSKNSKSSKSSKSSKQKSKNSSKK